MSNVPPNVADWLENEDAACREHRIARLEWLTALMPSVEFHAFRGGDLSVFLYEEARYCFVYGQYLSTIVLGLAFIERTLAAHLYAAGRDDLERANISLLLREANSTGLITDEEFEMLDRLRSIRNPIAHFRRPLDPEGLIRRTVEAETYAYDLIEEDARVVMDAIYYLLGTGLLSPGAG